MVYLTDQVDSGLPQAETAAHQSYSELIFGGNPNHPEIRPFISIEGGSWFNHEPWPFDHYAGQLRGLRMSSVPYDLQFGVGAVTFLDKDDPGRQVVGAAADGVSEVTIRISNLPEGIPPNQVVIEVGEGDGRLLGDKVVRGGVCTQTYVAPECFVSAPEATRL